MSLLYHNKDTLIKFKSMLLDILFPPICVSCKKLITSNSEEKSLCQPCFSSIRINKIIGLSKEGLAIASIGNYDDKALKEVIHSIKYGNMKSLRPSINSLIREYANLSRFLKNIDKTSSIIIPIPLHKKREKERGFNQSLIIAEELSKISNICIETSIIERAIYTKPQAGFKNINDRKKNIQRAFRLKNTAPKGIDTAIIVDDVYTSGFTVSESIKTLRKSGIKNFVIFVLGRTV